MHRIAILDLGTNTFHLLIFQVANGEFELILKKKEFVKLAAESLDKIAPKRFDRGIAVLSEYKKIVDEHQVRKVFAFATAGLRRPVNAADFIATAKNVTGFDIQIITGDEEAELIADREHDAGRYRRRADGRNHLRVQNRQQLARLGAVEQNRADMPARNHAHFLEGEVWSAVSRHETEEAAGTLGKKFGAEGLLDLPSCQGRESILHDLDALPHRKEAFEVIVTENENPAHERGSRTIRQRAANSEGHRERKVSIRFTAGRALAG